MNISFLFSFFIFSNFFRKIFYDQRMHNNLENHTHSLANGFHAFSFSFSFWDCSLSVSQGGSARLLKSMSTYWVLSSAPWMTNASVDVDGVSFRSKSTYIRPSLFTVWNKVSDKYLIYNFLKICFENMFHCIEEINHILYYHTYWSLIFLDFWRFCSNCWFF